VTHRRHARLDTEPLVRVVAQRDAGGRHDVGFGTEQVDPFDAWPHDRSGTRVVDGRTAHGETPPSVDGFEFAHELRKTDPDVAIVMVTALGEERDTVRGLDAGADDYVTKPFSMEELLARVRANLRRVKERAVLAHEALIEAGDLVIEPSQLRASVAGELVKLRLKEFQLLLALAKEPGALLTQQRLARDVWGYDHLASSRTIDVHIRRLRQAIEEASDYTYIQTVHGAGYRFEPRRKTERS
jgi:DNA-binding response OmpR family regulator